MLSTAATTTDEKQAVSLFIKNQFVVAKADVKQDSPVEAEQHPYSDPWGPRLFSKITTTQQVEMVRPKDKV